MIIFPANLGEGDHMGRPFTHFKSIPPQGTGEDIFLPIPGGITFNDGGSYGTIEMGALGAFMDMDYSMKAHADAQFAKGERGTVSSHIASIAKEMTKGGAQVLLDKAASMFVPGTYSKAMAAAKVVPNPSANVTFSGNNLREFNFNFTLVGRTRQDTQIIREIHNTFRINVYPKALRNEVNVYLEYPPVWTVKFLNGPGGEENQWLPKLYQCYLTQLSTNINPTALMYKVDHSPAELQLSLTFQETRTLMRYDIEDELNAG